MSSARRLPRIVNILMGCLILVLLAIYGFGARAYTATSEVVDESREILLLETMDAALQRIGLAVDGWALDPGASESVLADLVVSGALQELRRGVADLAGSIKEEDRDLAIRIGIELDAYEESLRLLEALVGNPDGLMTTYGGVVTPIERRLRTAFLDVRYEESEHLHESIEKAEAAGDLLKWLTPTLLALAMAVAATLQELQRRARRVDEIQEINESKTAFIASVSHELRTPLTVVLGLADEMRHRLDGLTPDEIEEFAGHISVQSKELSSIVEDLLAAAQAEIGSLRVYPVPAEVGPQIERVLAEVPANGVLTRSTVAPGIVADVDAGRFRQIMRNLIGNAHRYGGDRIEVEAGAENGHVVVRVRDNGEGIPESDRERIFEPFEIVRRRVGQPASVGLGLTVSRQLARLMDGDLIYRRVGEESVFELELPASSIT